MYLFLFSILARIMKGRPDVRNVGKVRKDYARFVSESLPRLISGVDGSDPLLQTLVVVTTR